MQLLFRWLRKKRHRARREARIEAAARMGYKIVPMTGSSGHVYTVETPDGTVLDNESMGFGSSKEAFRHAMKHAKAAANAKREMNASKPTT